MNELKKRLNELVVHLEIDQKRKRASELEVEMGESSFWQDRERAQRLTKELADITEQLEKIKKIGQEIESGELEKAEKDLGNLELLTFLGEEYDKGDAILSIHAGQGGVEAMDWAEMLLRMYIKFCERRGWKTQVVDTVSGEEAGIKSTTILVNGDYTYGYLKNESGTHRLVRLSPFNAQRLRQTSFALVEVLPQLPGGEKIELREDDLEWQFFHASSHGGQNVQKVATAVRLTHKPTGITVTAQTERFQEQNRKIARVLLSSKLWSFQKEKEKERELELKGTYRPATWGTQIRSYILHPYKLVRDLRTDVESVSPENVLDGQLDEFIEKEVRLSK